MAAIEAIGSEQGPKKIWQLFQENDSGGTKQTSLRDKLWSTDVFSYAANCQGAGAHNG